MFLSSFYSIILLTIFINRPKSNPPPNSPLVVLPSRAPLLPLITKFLPEVLDLVSYSLKGVDEEG